MESHEISEEELKSELAASITERTRLGQLFDSIRAKVVELREMLSAKHAVI